MAISPRLRALIPALVICTLLFAPSAWAKDKVFNAESFTLDNGLQVVVIPNHRAPVVTHMVWYKVGAADEPEGLTGIAHFLEHLMFKGTKNIPPGEFSKRIRALGGNDNAFTNQDYTAYFQTISKDHLETVMTMEADRMQGLVLPPELIDSERKVVMEERRQRTENDPYAFFGEQMRALLFVNHPYGDPVIGWMEEIANLPYEEIINFYKTWYAPNNAILVISGDVTAEEVRPLAEKIYGPLKPHELPSRQWTDVPPAPGLPLLLEQDPRIEQASFTQIFRVPSYNKDKKAALALQVLEDILDGGAATRLYRTLVVERKIASSAGFSYNGDSFSDGSAYVSITPLDGVGLETLRSAVEGILRDIIENGLTDDELREAKDRLKDEAVFARDSLSGPARIFGSSLATGSTIDDIEYWPDLIEAVTAAQVQEVAKTYLNPENYGAHPYVTGYLVPAPAPQAPEQPEEAVQPETAPAATAPQEETVQ